jgi:ABC-type uncharacterized transport system substrate-binding protein
VREIAPKISRVALLMNSTNPNVKVEEADAVAGAEKMGLETVTLNATNPPEIDAAFEQLVDAQADAIITAPIQSFWIAANRLSRLLPDTNSQRWGSCVNSLP